MYSTFNREAQRQHRHVRVRAKISGSAARPRVSIYRSNKFIYAALVDDTAHKTIAATSSAKLGLDNPSNIDAAKATGADLAKKALALGVAEVVFDRSGYIYHGQVQALADALREGGLKF